MQTLRGENISQTTGCDIWDHQFSSLGIQANPNQKSDNIFIHFHCNIISLLFFKTNRTWAASIRPLSESQVTLPHVYHFDNSEGARPFDFSAYFAAPNQNWAKKNI